jgi:GalNAc-alpha-(1->4)-GalNAc-alpha-(1->3)-diNAcBac-PP-undecaprenol alpha-1,4-N-acetyl-D-galactosaminyltransferase
MSNQEKKSVVFISRGLGIGGAQKILTFVANACANAGYDTTIISIAPTQPSVVFHNNVKVLFMNYPWKDFNELNFIRRRIRVLKIILEIRKLIKSIRPDAICAFIVDIVGIARISTIGLGIPIIVSERDNPYIFERSQRLIAEHNYSKSNAVVFQTEKAMNAFSEKVKKRAHIIPNPCIPRIKHIQPFRGKRKPIIVAAGRLEEVKQFDVLIKAFSKVIKKHPEFALHIFGEGGERDNLMKLIDELALNQHVIIKGAVNDVFAEVNDCTAFVLPSKSEGIPNVLIEALSIGMPCISMDCDPGGPRQLLDNGRRGKLVPVGDIDGLSDAICYYIENPESAEKFGNFGLEIIEELAPDKIAHKWLEVFADVLEKVEN